MQQHRTSLFHAALSKLALALLVGGGASHGQDIDFLDPEFGSVGQQVNIFGNGFSPGVVTVRFSNNKVASANATSPTQIVATVPPGAVTGPISVQIGTGTPVFTTNDFTVIGPGPYITGFTPGTGNATTPVVIDGVHFTGATAVRFNGLIAPGAFVSGDTQIQVNAPGGVSTGPISVERTGVGTNTTSQNFFVPPAITGFAPANGRVGTNVTIAGRNFTGATSLRFNNIFATTWAVNSATQIVATVPTNAATGSIRVSAPAADFITSSNFIVQPTLLGFAPGFGPVGTPVTVSGFALLGTTNVRFNGVTATFSNVNYSQLIAVVPPGATTGRISITTTNGGFTNANNFFLPPSISSFTPNTAPIGGTVNVTGSNFIGATAVAFNGVAAAGFTVASNNFLQATNPSGVLTGPISVTAPAGTANSLALFFGPPTIGGFDPTHGVPGQRVTLTGTNFTGATAVRFNGVNAAAFTVTNNFLLGATAPATLQTGPVSVVTPGGTNTTSASFVLDVLANLALTFTDAPDPVMVTSNLVYTLLVNNTGPNTASNATLLVTLPGSVVLKSAATTAGTVFTNANPIFADFGHLLNGGQATVTLTVLPLAPGIITTPATAASSSSDTNAANNTVSVTTTVLPFPVLTIQSATPGQVRIAWPVLLTNFVLESKATLTGAVPWVSNPAPVTVSGNERQVTETNLSGTKFYRLRQ